MADITKTQDAAADRAAARTTWPVPRTRTPRILVAVATILAVVSIVSVWIRTQTLNTDAWVELSSELLEEPAVQEALSAYLVEVVYQHTDVVASFENRLPDGLKGIATPIAGVVREPLTNSVERLLGSDRFQSAWEAANRVAHQTFVNILRGDTREGISVSGGRVALDVKPMLVDVAQTIGVSGDRIQELPNDAGQIVVFDSDELAAAQRWVAVTEFTAWLLTVVVIALYVLAVYLARGRRLQTLRTVGWSLVGVGVAVLLIQAIALEGTLNAMVEDPQKRSIAGLVASDGTGLLRQMAWSVLIYGAVIVLFTSLLGEHRWAIAARRALAPVFTGSTATVAGTAVVSILLLVWWSPGQAFESWASGLVLAALTLGALAAVRTQLRREFPDGVVVAEAEAAVGNGAEGPS